jgi:hypothetical protein
MFLFFVVCWRPKNSPAKHGQRWPTVPLDESPPESHGTTKRNGPTTRKRCHHQTKKENDKNTQSQACAHVVWCRRVVGRGVALRLQPEVLQSSSREVRATATRRCTARRRCMGTTVPHGPWMCPSIQVHAHGACSFHIYIYIYIYGRVPIWVGGHVT